MGRELEANRNISVRLVADRSTAQSVSTTFGGACEVKAVQEWRLRGKPMLTNEAQPADQLSHYTPYSELEPFRIDPAVMGMFDPDYRDLVRGPGVFQLRDRWSLSGAGTHDGVGSPQPNAWAAPPIPPGAKSGLGYHDVARAEWSRGRFITRSSG
jgi:hypothetical protein